MLKVISVLKILNEPIHRNTRVRYSRGGAKKNSTPGRMREMHSPGPIIRSRVNSRNSCRRRVTIAVVCAPHPC